MSNRKNFFEIYKSFIKSIESQSIVLKRIDFKANTKIEGEIKEEKIRREFKINKVKVSLGEVLKDPENDNSRSLPVIVVSYEGEHKDILLINKKKEKITYARFEFDIKLILKENSIFLNLNEDEQNDIIKYFVNTTGKLMLFPYIRHILHFLFLEAGLMLPPLKPIIIK